MPSKYVKSLKVFSGDCSVCGDPWEASGQGAHLKTKCADCTNDVKLKMAAYAVKSNPSEFDDRKFCQLKGCNKKIPTSRGVKAEYCTQVHKRQGRYAKEKAKKAQQEEVTSLFRTPDQETKIKQERQGWIYEKINNDPILKGQLLSGEITASAAAIILDCTTAGVTRAMQAILHDIAIAGQRADWAQSKRTRAMLPKELMAMAKQMGRDGMALDHPNMILMVDHLVRCYVVFSKRYFNLEGKRPLIKDFHVKWVRSIIEAYLTGGKRLILSPPRHGKSETLIRFCVWFICMDPNIRIGWFCAGTDVAKLMLGSVKDYFESHEQLIKDVLPPGELFNPGLKSSKPWSAKEIKVAQQSHVGAKSSSLLALGRTSKFLSRDMDIIIIDDLEDYDSTREESQRIYSRNKLAEIGTRKVEETAEVAIGSRQHPDDISNHLLQLQGSILQWEVIVDSAHDIDCPEDPDDFDKHYDCMLFPEVRSYRYLMEKKLEMETLGLGHLYPLRYLNIPIPPEGQVFDVETIREQSLNRERGIGLQGLPLGHLVGGLDPSARGIQASFLWHYRAHAELGVKMSMVDLDELQSGGVAGAVKIILAWYEKYGLTVWFYEVNSQQIEFYKLVKAAVEKAMVTKYGGNPIVIKEHSTGKNKQDAELGISAMAPLYHGGNVDLPYGTNEARKKVNSLLRQLELWTTDGVASKKVKTDIKMAQWFPFVGRIQSFLKGQRAMNLELSDEASYPGVESFGSAPWETQYPGG